MGQKFGFEGANEPGGGLGSRGMPGQETDQNDQGDGDQIDDSNLADRVEGHQGGQRMRHHPHNFERLTNDSDNDDNGYEKNDAADDRRLQDLNLTFHFPLQ